MDLYQQEKAIYVLLLILHQVLYFLDLYMPQAVIFFRFVYAEGAQ